MDALWGAETGPKTGCSRQSTVQEIKGLVSLSICRLGKEANGLIGTRHRTIERYCSSVENCSSRMLNCRLKAYRTRKMYILAAVMVSSAYPRSEAKIALWKRISENFVTLKIFDMNTVSAVEDRTTSSIAYYQVGTAIQLSLIIR